MGLTPRNEAQSPAGETADGFRLGAGSPRPHICFVAMSIYPTLVGDTTVEVAGGGEVQQSVLAHALVKDGYRVSVLTADHGQGPLRRHRGIDIHALPSPEGRGWPGLRQFHPQLSDVYRKLCQINPDILYFCVCGFRAAAVAAYARRHHKRFIYQCGSDREFLKPVPGMPRRDYWLFRWALPRAHAILVQNLTQLQQLQTHHQRAGWLVPSLYEESGIPIAQPGGPVLWVGTFKPVKRPELFIELARSCPQQRFVMVGGPDHPNDPGQAYFRQMRERAQAVPNLRFEGFVPFAEVGEHFNRASFLVNTSDSEGFPNTFLQAWARGIPSLSFVRPETQAGHSGTVACDNPADMRDKLLHLAGQATRWLQASQRCLEHFEVTHSKAAVLPRYRQIFEALHPAHGEGALA
jgi:glycosyltransferase involved in cell wall biosynthesis